MNRDEVWLLNEKYIGKKTEGFFADVERLNRGEPLAYVIGSVPFLSTTIFLDSHPLIPRTETEFWVEKTIHKIKQDFSNEPVHILDVCAGSGCIGVAVLSEIQSAHVDFVEIDTAHHKTILKNIRENSIDETRTRILGGDLFERVTGTYDVILSNPPYVNPSLNRVDENVLSHEPAGALFGGARGMEIIERIIKDAPLFLKPNGLLVIEHEPEQANDMEILATNYSFVCASHPDQFGVARYSYLVLTP